MRILLLLILFLATLFAKTTLCYKENTTISKINKFILLDGGECQGKLSAQDMEKYGWNIKYAQVTKAKSFYNHLIIFNKTTQKDIIKEQIQKQNIKSNFDFKTIQLPITVKSDGKITIPKGNLKIGQSGVIIHQYNKEHSLIIATASVIDSSKTQSNLKVLKQPILTQNAIPTSKLTPKTGDIFVLNHIYHSSLLVVPNYESFKTIKHIYPEQNFLNPDIFAAYLKINNTPVPTKKDIQQFCKDTDIGTIFIVANNNLYILDTNTFKLLYQTTLNIKNEDTQVPFFTKITDIQRAVLDFGDEKIQNYDKYYISIIKNSKYDNKDKNSIFSKLMEMIK